MCVKIDCTTNLNRNSYNKIIIIEDPTEEKFSIHVGGKIRKNEGIYPTIPEKFSSRIRGKSDYRKLKEVVDYFLENHRITSLQDSQILPFYLDKFSCICSKDCFLALKLFHYKDILSNCIKKYQIDRAKFVLENEHVCNYCFYLDSKESKYDKYVLGNEEYINFKLFAKDGVIHKMDKKFLQEFVRNKLYESGEKAIITSFDEYHSHTFSGVKKTYLISGNLKIDIWDKQIIEILKEIVNEHNCSLEKNKVKQIKMEGF